jgi:hypothetical protein
MLAAITGTSAHQVGGVLRAIRHHSNFEPPFVHKKFPHEVWDLAPDPTGEGYDLVETQVAKFAALLLNTCIDDGTNVGPVFTPRPSRLDETPSFPPWWNVGKLARHSEMPYLQIYSLLARFVPNEGQNNMMVDPSPDRPVERAWKISPHPTSPLRLRYVHDDDVAAFLKAYFDFAPPTRHALADTPLSDSHFLQNLPGFLERTEERGAGPQVADLARYVHDRYPSDEKPTMRNLHIAAGLLAGGQMADNLARPQNTSFPFIAAAVLGLPPESLYQPVLARLDTEQARPWLMGLKRAKRLLTIAERSRTRHREAFAEVVQRFSKNLPSTTKIESAIQFGIAIANHPGLAKASPKARIAIAARLAHYFDGSQTADALDSSGNLTSDAVMLVSLERIPSRELERSIPFLGRNLIWTDVLRQSQTEQSLRGDARYDGHRKLAALIRETRLFVLPVVEVYLDKPFTALERSNVAVALRDPEARGLSGAEREIKLLIKGLTIARNQQRAAVIDMAPAASTSEMDLTAAAGEKIASPAEMFGTAADGVVDNIAVPAKIGADVSVPPAHPGVGATGEVAAAVEAALPEPPAMSKQQKKEMALGRLGDAIRNRNLGLS